MICAERAARERAGLKTSIQGAVRDDNVKRKSKKNIKNVTAGRNLFFWFMDQAGLFFFQEAVDFFYQGDQLVGILFFFG